MTELTKDQIGALLPRYKFRFTLMKKEKKISECSVVYYAKEAHDSQAARVVEIGIENEWYEPRGKPRPPCAARRQGITPGAD